MCKEIRVDAYEIVRRQRRLEDAYEWLNKHGAFLAVAIGMAWIVFENVPVITLLAGYSVCFALLSLKYRVDWLRSSLAAVCAPAAVSAVAFGFGPISDRLKDMLVLHLGLGLEAAAGAWLVSRVMEGWLSLNAVRLILAVILRAADEAASAVEYHRLKKACGPAR